jgi:hypothetical protein
MSMLPCRLSDQLLHRWQISRQVKNVGVRIIIYVKGH